MNKRNVAGRNDHAAFGKVFCQRKFLAGFDFNSVYGASRTGMTCVCRSARIVSTVGLCYKHHSLTHHLDEPELIKLFHVFISLVILDNDQLRFLGDTL